MAVAMAGWLAVYWLSISVGCVCITGVCYAGQCNVVLYVQVHVAFELGGY